MPAGVESGLQATRVGGLGFPDLELMGFALRACWLWLRKIDPQKPWAFLPDSVKKLVRDLFIPSSSTLAMEQQLYSGYIAGYKAVRLLRSPLPYQNSWASNSEEADCLRGTDRLKASRPLISVWKLMTIIVD
jgi:hypothetical protein